MKIGTLELLNSDLTIRMEYSASFAYDRHLEKMGFSGPELKIGHDFKLAEYIEDKIINKKYSPYAVLQDIINLKKSFGVTICVKTLYNYINKGIFLNLTKKDLPVKKEYKK